MSRTCSTTNVRGSGWGY